MTAINSGGLWYGGIDGAIQRVAGNLYHAQAADEMPLSDLQTIVAKRYKSDHVAKFDDVIFVVDDLKSPLDKVIYEGLKTAHEQHYSKILIPAVRMGVMAGAVEKTPEETTAKIAKGIQDFTKDYGAQTTLENITFVVYRDPKVMQRLENTLSLLPSPN